MFGEFFDLVEVAAVKLIKGGGDIGINLGVELRRAGPDEVLDEETPVSLSTSSGLSRECRRRSPALRGRGGKRLSVRWLPPVRDALEFF